MYNRSKNNFFNKDQQKANYGKFNSSLLQKGENNNLNNIVNNNLYKKSEILTNKIIGNNSIKRSSQNNILSNNINIEENDNNKIKTRSNKNDIMISSSSFKEEKINLANEVMKKEIELLKAELSLANSVNIFN